MLRGGAPGAGLEGNKVEATNHVRVKDTTATGPLNSALNHAEWAALDVAVFDGSARLEAIRDLARARRVGPMALLLATLIRVATSTAPAVMLDAGGGPAALNLFGVIVGPSGAGKDRAITAADGLVAISGGHPVSLPTYPPGSGEGLVGVFLPKATIAGDVPGDDRALFVETEVTSLGTLMARRGSTLRSSLLKAYSGSELGVTNKGGAATVAAGKYRLGLILGAQPDRLGPLLEESADGLPQRMAWTETLDPLRRPGADYRAPAPIRVELPATERVTYCPEVVDATRAADERRLLTGDTGGLDGHRHLCTLKFAAAIALLRERSHVEPDDWRRARALIGYSDRVRNAALARLEAIRVMDVAARKIRDDAAEDAARRERIAVVRERVLGRMEAAEPGPDGWINLAVVSRTLSRSQRAVLPEVMESLATGDGDHRLVEARVNSDPRAKGAAQVRFLR